MSRIAPSGQLRQREPRIRDKAHLGRVAQLPCVVCLAAGVVNRRVHVAHVRASYPDEPGWREVGKSEKPSDVRTLPLCPFHHVDGPNAQHKNRLPGGERAWWAHHGIYPPALCEALTAAFAAGESGEKVLLSFAAQARRGLRPPP